MTGADDRTRTRILSLGVLIVVMIGVLTTRLWFLQVLAGEDFSNRSFTNHVRIISEPAPRGRILDRNGVVLVGNRTALAISINRDTFPKDEGQARRVKARLSSLLAIPVADIDKRLADKRISPYAPVTIASDVSRIAFFTVREHPRDYPGVGTAVVAVRTYPHGVLGAHVFGYVGEVNANDLSSKKYATYQAGDQIGRTGIEREYERWLHGETGTAKLEIDARGRVLSTLGVKDPMPGNDVQLAIDVDVQKVAEESLQQGMERARQRTCPGNRASRRCLAPAGAAVVMDARTGGVVAMASAPTFDLRKFVGGVSQEYFDTLFDPKSQWPKKNGKPLLDKNGNPIPSCEFVAHCPLLNRATQSSYPPGSTFKPLLSIGALTSGDATAKGRYPCTTLYHYGDRDFHNWKAGSGPISLAQALIESCDTVFYSFGADWWRTERTAEVAGKTVYEIMQDWSRRFGLGASTGVDLPTEVSGRVPDRVYKRGLWDQSKDSYCKTYYESKDRVYQDLCLRGFLWNPGDSINMSIGQGDVEVTPLQLADAYGAIANGGAVLTPHIVQKVKASSGDVLLDVKPTVRSRLKAPRAAVTYVQRALARVPISGTAKFPYRNWPFGRLPVFAKTGSAEIAGKQPFSWFATYGPRDADGHQYVVVSVVEQAGHGSEVAGPVVRRIMDQLYGLPLTPIVYGSRSD